MYPEGIRNELKRAPAGWVLFSIENVSRETRLAQAIEKSVESVKMKVVAPEAYEGIDHEEVFWLGTDDDPKAERPETIQRTAAKFKAFAAVLGVNIEGQDEDLVRSQLKDQKILGHMSHKVSASGFVNAKPISWHAEGEHEVSADEEQMTAMREQSMAIQQNGGAQKGQGTLPPRFAAQARPVAPLPPARPASAGPRLSGR